MAQLLGLPRCESEAAFPCRAGPMLDADAFETVRRAMVLDHCKWDPQVGDVGTLAPFPLLLRESTWRRLARWAEALAAEASAAEAELIDRPELLRILGLPRSVRRVLASARRDGLTPALARVIRFDFHPTTEGWRISEGNSECPVGSRRHRALPA